MFLVGQAVEDVVDRGACHPEIQRYSRCLRDDYKMLMGVDGTGATGDYLTASKI